MKSIITLLLLFTATVGFCQVTYLQKPENLDSLKYDSLLVLSHGATAKAKERLETTVTDFFGENGVIASPSMDFIPPATPLDSIPVDTLKQMIVSRGFDAVFVVDVFNIRYKEAKKNNIQGGSYEQDGTDYKFDIASINLYGSNGITKQVSKIDLRFALISSESGKIFEFIITIANPKSPNKLEKRLKKVLLAELSKLKFL